MRNQRQNTRRREETESPENFTFEEASSSDDSLSDDNDSEFNINDLYKHIGAPNPLHERNLKHNEEVKTAYRLNFKKLPNGIDIIKNDQKKISPIVHKKLFKEDSVYSDEQETKGTSDRKSQDDNFSLSKTLFTLYPEGDTRLVYKKYANQGDWQLTQKCFANYLINIKKIGKFAKTQYLTTGDDTFRLNSHREESTLNFDSKFESGNLYSVYKISEFEYDLILQNDINTKGHTQWFFFSVENTKKNSVVKFNIVNLLKPDSLFNEGMQPVIFSSTSSKLENKGWFKGGTQISYFKNNIIREGVPIQKSYYTLTFTYTFQHSNDTVYFAHCFPYTYSRLNVFLKGICDNPNTKKYIVRKTLCKTLTGNDCEYLTISSAKAFENMVKDERHGVVLTARQHPGESLSSYMMQGIIEFLTSKEEEAEYMRQKCVFKIVPMLNPDGVIHGNYRASMAGSDLNRRWKIPKKRLHPTIYYVKKLIRDFQANRPLQMFCDFHGHSRKKNTFFYGNSTEENPYSARVFPYMLSKLSKYVTFEDCRFVVQKAKESTARITLWRELKIDNIFTLEASFHGYEENGKTYAFTEQDYINIGKDFCRGLYQYLATVVFNTTSISKPLSSERESPDIQNQTQYFSEGTTMNDCSTMSKVSLPNNNKMKIRQSRTGSIPKANIMFNAAELIKELTQNKELINIGFQGDDSGSDSNPSEDDIPQTELKKYLPIKLKNPKKAKKKAKKKQEKNSSTDSPKKLERSQPEQRGPTPNGLTVKTEISTVLPIIKEEKIKPNSEKSANFRIKNIKRTLQNNVLTSIGEPQSKEVIMMDNETQTEEIYFTDVEDPLTNKTKELKGNLGQTYQRDSRIQLTRFLNKSANNLKPTPPEPSLNNFGYLNILNKTSKGSVKGNPGLLFIQGARLESDTTTKIEQYYGARDQISKGTCTESESKFQHRFEPFVGIQSINNSFARNQDRIKERALTLTLKSNKPEPEEEKSNQKSYIQEEGEGRLMRTFSETFFNAQINSQKASGVEGKLSSRAFTAAKEGDGNRLQAFKHFNNSGKPPLALNLKNVNTLISEVVKENSFEAEPHDPSLLEKSGGGKKKPRKNSSPISGGQKFFSEAKSNPTLQPGALLINEKQGDTSIVSKGNLFSKYIKKGYLIGIGSNSRPGTSAGNTLIQNLNRLEQTNSKSEKKLIQKSGSPDIKFRIQKKLEILTSVNQNNFPKTNPNYFLKKL